MIVVDTNVIAYAVLPGDRTPAALALVERDPEWIAPTLWRSELRNVLATMMRERDLSLGKAVAAFSEAERLVADAPFEAPARDCLRLAAAGRVSAYDAEFVWTAMHLGATLVSADRRLGRAFPESVISLEAAAFPD